MNTSSGTKYEILIVTIYCEIQYKYVKKKSKERGRQCGRNKNGETKNKIYFIVYMKLTYYEMFNYNFTSN